MNYTFLNCGNGCVTESFCFESCQNYILNESKYYLGFLLIFYFMMTFFYDNKILIKIENLIENKFNYKLGLNLQKLFINFVKVVSLLIIIFELYKIIFMGFEL